MKPQVIMERYPYRYVQSGILDNGTPDFRIQKFNEVTDKYRDMYLCDNAMPVSYTHLRAHET